MELNTPRSLLHVEDVRKDGKNMTHYVCLVLLPKGKRCSERAVSEALAPFDENDERVCRRKENKWDWYAIGGRWDQRPIAKHAHSDRCWECPRKGDLPGRNAQKAGEFLEAGFIPSAVLTPEGEWIQDGETGWWGISVGRRLDGKESLGPFDDDGTPEADSMLAGVLAQYSDSVAVLCDLHI